MTVISCAGGNGEERKKRKNIWRSFVPILISSENLSILITYFLFFLKTIFFRKSDLLGSLIPKDIILPQFALWFEDKTMYQMSAWHPSWRMAAILIFFHGQHFFLKEWSLRNDHAKRLAFITICAMVFYHHEKYKTTI